MIKDGVDVSRLMPEIWVGLDILHDALQELGYNLTITAGSEGSHGYGSLHYIGAAADIRSKMIKSETEKRKVFDIIKTQLPSGFDFVYEPTHYHLEYQPKNRSEVIQCNQNK